MKDAKPPDVRSRWLMRPKRVAPQGQLQRPPTPPELGGGRSQWRLYFHPLPLDTGSGWKAALLGTRAAGTGFRGCGCQRQLQGSLDWQ